MIDRQVAGANTSRAAVVNARSLEVLEDLDVARRIVKEGDSSPRDSPCRTERRTLIPIDFSALPTEYPYSLMVPQSTTERLLLDRLVELGGSVIRPKTLTSVVQDADGVTATFDDGDTVRARYVVGADGIHSKVREQAGIGFEGGQYEESFLLADVRLTGDAPADEVILYWATAGLTVVAPLPGDIYRIVAPVPDAPGDPSAHSVQDILDTRDREWAHGRHRGHLGFSIPHPSPGRRDLPGGSAVAGRRRGARAQPGRRAGHEPRHPGCRRTQRSAGRRPRRRPGLVA